MTSNPSLKKVSFDSLENSSHSFSTSTKNSKTVISNNIFNVSSLLDNYMKIESFYCDGTINNYLMSVSENDKNEKRLQKENQNNISNMKLEHNQSESLKEEGYLSENKYESNENLMMDDDRKTTQAYLQENRTLKLSDDFLSTMNQNITVDHLRISSFCRFAEQDDLSTSSVFVCSKISFNLSQNCLNKILLSQTKLFINLNCDYVFQIDINGNRAENSNDLIVNSGVFLGIEGKRLKVGANLVEIVTGGGKIDYLLNEGKQIVKKFRIKFI